MYPLVMSNIAIEHGPVEMVDLPSGKLTQQLKMAIYSGFSQ